MIATAIPLRRSALAALSVAVLAVAGCGGSESSPGDTDPASVVPASAPAYVGVEVRPEDDLKQNTDAVSKALLGTEDPGQAVVEFLQPRVAAFNGLTYEADIEPWLGDRVGLALMPVSESENKLLLVAASRDDDKADKALESSDTLSAQASFQGVEYSRTPNGSAAAAVFDGSVVLGDERAVKLAIAASKDDTDLAASQRYENALAEVPDDGIATVYLDIDALAGTLAGLIGEGTTGDIVRTLLTGQGDAIAAALIPEGDSIRVEAAGTATGKGLTAIQAQGGASDAIRTLPSDAWLALGVSDVGKTVELLLRGLTSAGGLQAIGLNLVLSRLEESTGLSVSRDVLAWMGSGGLFVRGTKRGEVGGALVVQSSDPAAMRRAVRRLRAALGDLQLPGVPAVSGLSAKGVDEGMTLALGDTPIKIAAADDQLVIAIGPGALATALGPADELQNSPEFKAAEGRLGDDLRAGFYLDFQQAADLVESYAGDNRDAVALAGVLRGLTQAAGGGTQDGDVSRVRIVAGVKQP